MSSTFFKLFLVFFVLIDCLTSDFAIIAPFILLVNCFFLIFSFFSIISIQTPFSAFFSTFVINLFSNMKKGHLSAPSQICVLLPSINRNTEHNWLIALHSTLNMKTFLVSCPSKLSIFAKHLYLANDSVKVCLLTCILNTK